MSLSESLTNLANKFRQKGFTSNKLKIDDMADLMVQVPNPNLLQDTETFSQPKLWVNYDMWTKTSELDPLGNTVLLKSSSWTGIYQLVNVPSGTHAYTWSINYKLGTDYNGIIGLYNDGTCGLKNPLPNSVSVIKDNQWHRLVATIITNSGGTLGIRLESSVDNQKVEIASMKLEGGNQYTGFIRK